MIKIIYIIISVFLFIFLLNINIRLNLISAFSNYPGKLFLLLFDV